MRALIAGLALLVTAACGPRQVEVGTGAPPAGSDMTLTLTNNDGQAVNVYYVSGGGTENFIGEVGARSTQTLTIRGLPSGSSVTLRAARKDGSRRWDRNATLSGAYSWTIP
jgi:hypothetical protein